ncbi:MAG: cytidylate kinase-like family protein [Lachnospiraceae bacterium]|nr:cytidylate kinase-like family protein [Lachnospiraceae bacterium]
MDKYVITIGRQFGSGGRALGSILSKKLGIPFYDKELLLQAAEENGINPDFFVNNDERVPSFFNGIIPFSMGVNPMPWYSGSTSISDDSIYRAQSDFIRQIADRGPCIIVGRSADYVLRDAKNLITVFVHARPEDCAKRIVERGEGRDMDKALRMGERINKLRANYYNFYTDKRWGDASSYDLTFNSSSLSLDDIAEVIIDYLNRRLAKE